jgi:hypothetical protein
MTHSEKPAAIRKVFKYLLPRLDEFTLELPEGAQLLSVQAQGNEPMLWALVDENAPSKVRSFILRGSGHAIALPSASYWYVGTVQLHGGHFVGHVFEVLGSPPTGAPRALRQRSAVGDQPWPP